MSSLSLLLLSISTTRASHFNLVARALAISMREAESRNITQPCTAPRLATCKKGHEVKSIVNVATQ